MLRRALVLALAAVAVVVAAAQADWTGDGKADVLAINPDGQLLLYRTDGAGNFNSAKQVIGTGWGSFTAFLSPGDWTGDGHPDLLARKDNGDLLLYRGDGDGGFIAGSAERIGAGWGQFNALLTPGDWDGDGHADLIARKSDGSLLLYRGNGAGHFVSEARKQIGSGWGQFTALLTPGDWDGDGHPDVIARKSDGALLLYRGNGVGGFVSEARKQIGSGWQQFTALIAGGDFDGDHHPDVLARTSDGRLLLYRSNGAGAFLSEPRKVVGSSGWQSLTSITLLGNDPPPPPTPTPAPTPPPAPTSPPAPVGSGGSATLTAGLDCVPPGQKVRVTLRIHRKAGRARPRVTKVLFFIRGGARRTDRKAPYLTRLRVGKPAGAKFRVYARVSFKRRGAKHIRHTTVWRRYVVCA